MGREKVGRIPSPPSKSISFSCAASSMLFPSGTWMVDSLPDFSIKVTEILRAEHLGCVGWGHSPWANAGHDGWFHAARRTVIVGS
jgi:hypothetical protein